jgi:hypothetical protein
MEGLVKAATDFLAAILRPLGFVGAPRRRSGIREDLELLGALRDSPDFGTDSVAHRFLVEHVTTEVAKLAGIELKRKRKIPWGPVAFALLIAVPLAYWTYKLNQDGFQLLSLLPGTFAAMMLVSVFGMLLGEEESPEGEATNGDATSADAGSPSTASTAPSDPESRGLGT